MGWSGGTYSKGNSATGGWTGDASLGIGIEAGRHDTQDNDFATGINNCIAKDGQNAATADLPMGAFKHTNVANATARNNYAAVGQVQDGDFIWLGTTGGTATAQTATATPAITAYKAGQKFRMQIGSGLGSTGSVATAHTININGIGAKNIVNNEDSTNPTLGTWVAGALMELVYDGTNFRITNDPGGWLTYTPTITITSGSISSITVSEARYRKLGKNIKLYLYLGVFNTVSGGQINISVPVNSGVAVGAYIASTLNYNGAAWNPGLTYNNTLSSWRVYATTSGTNFGTASSQSMAIDLFYPSV
jgi:hypothetical protein